MVVWHRQVCRRFTLIFTPVVRAPCFVNSKRCGIDVVRPAYVGKLSYDRLWIDRLFCISQWQTFCTHLQPSLYNLQCIYIAHTTYAVVQPVWTLLRSVSNHICFFCCCLWSITTFSNYLLFCILCTVIICTVLATSRCKNFLYWLIDWLMSQNKLHEHEQCTF